MGKRNSNASPGTNLRHRVPVYAPVPRIPGQLRFSRGARDLIPAAPRHSARVQAEPGLPRLGQRMDPHHPILPGISDTPHKGQGDKGTGDKRQDKGQGDGATALSSADEPYKRERQRPLPKSILEFIDRDAANHNLSPSRAQVKRGGEGGKGVGGWEGQVANRGYVRESSINPPRELIFLWDGWLLQVRSLRRDVMPALPDHCGVSRGIERARIMETHIHPRGPTRVDYMTDEWRAANTRGDPTPPASSPGSVGTSYRRY